MHFSPGSDFRLLVCGLVFVVYYIPKIKTLNFHVSYWEHWVCMLSFFQPPAGWFGILAIIFNSEQFYQAVSKLTLLSFLPDLLQSSAEVVSQIAWNSFVSSICSWPWMPYDVVSLWARVDMLDCWCKAMPVLDFLILIYLVVVYILLHPHLKRWLSMFMWILASYLPLLRCLYTTLLSFLTYFSAA